MDKKSTNKIICLKRGIVFLLAICLVFPVWTSAGYCAYASESAYLASGGLNEGTETGNDTEEPVTEAYTVAISNYSGSSCGSISLNGTSRPDGTYYIMKNDSARIEITANNGYEISKIKVNGGFISLKSTEKYSYTFTVDDNTDTIVIAEFKAESSSDKYTVTRDDTLNGSVTLSNGNVTLSRTNSVNYGTSITVKSRPYSGYHIEGVYVNDRYIGRSTTTSFTVREDCSVWVNFERGSYYYDDDDDYYYDDDYYIITCTAGSNGSLSEEGDVEVEYKDSLEVDIIPDIGYRVDKVYVDGSSKGSVKKYIFSNVRADHTIRATFKRDSNRYTITGYAGEGGYLNITEQEFEAGEDFRLTVTPYSGYTVQQVKIDGSNKGAIRTYSFDAIDKNHTVDATFVRTDGTSAAPSGSSSNTGTRVPSYTTINSGGTSGTSSNNGSGTGTASTNNSRGSGSSAANAGNSARVTKSIPFYDVTVSDWYYEAVRYDYENDIVDTETNGNYYRPMERASRADLVDMIYRCEGSPKVNTDSLRFRDVNPGSNYCSAVVWASDAGIVNGVSNNEFMPDGAITREQIAAMMYRYAYYRNTSGSLNTSSARLSTFPDYSYVSGFAYIPMCWTVNSGVMQGDNMGYLNPQGTATRGELAQMVARLDSDIIK